MQLVPLFAALVAGYTVALPSAAVCDNCGDTELKGSCKPVTFIFARATGEPGGSLGILVGPGVYLGLKHRYGIKNVAAVGVRYPAKLEGNYEPEGCGTEGIEQFIADLKETATKCPETSIVAGGFSQGAACLHAAMKRLDPATISRIVGAVTFGDPRNKQDNGRIPKYPEAKTKIFCASADPICQGELKTTAAHRSYYKDIGPAVKFLSGQIGDVKGGSKEEPGSKQKQKQKKPQ